MNTKHRSHYFSATAFILSAVLPNIALAQNSPSPMERAARVRVETDQIEVRSDGTALETVHRELQVLTAAAAKVLAQAPIRYIASMQDLDIVEAYTLKGDGRRLPVDASGIVTQQPPGPPLVPLFTDIKQKVIVFPNVEPGDTLIFTSRLRDNQTFFRGQFLHQTFIPQPVEEDDLTVTLLVPQTLKATLESHDLQFQKTAERGNDVYTLHYSNLNPVAKDVGAVSQFDRLPRYFVSTFKTYDDLAHAYAALIQTKTAVTRKIQMQADSITAGITDRREQARAIYEWINQHVRYVAIELGQGAIVPHDAESVLNNAYGDCKDLTILFLAMLKAKGIDSQPVLLNLGNGYTLSTIPTLAQLNHMIAWLPEFKTYADTTAGVVPFGFLPLTEYGKPIVLVGAGDAGLRQIPVLPPDSGSITYRNVAKLDDMMRLTDESTTTATGAFVAQLRVSGALIQAGGPDSVANAMLKSRNLPSATGTFTVGALGNFLPQYSLASKFSTAPLNVRGMEVGLRVAERTGDVLMGSMTNTELKDTDPTPCYSAHTVEDLSLEFPATRRLQKLPPDTETKTANLHFSSHWSIEGQTVSVHREFTSTIDQPLCTGDVRKETAAALARIKEDHEAPIALALNLGSAPTAARTEQAHNILTTFDGQYVGAPIGTNAGIFNGRPCTEQRHTPVTLLVVNGNVTLLYNPFNHLTFSGPVADDGAVAISGRTDFGPAGILSGVLANGEFDGRTSGLSCNVELKLKRTSGPLPDGTVKGNPNARAGANADAGPN